VESQTDTVNSGGPRRSGYHAMLFAMHPIRLVRAFAAVRIFIMRLYIGGTKTPLQVAERRRYRQDIMHKPCGWSSGCKDRHATTGAG
jgi:hypothetical protein